MRMYLDGKGKARVKFNLKELILYFSVWFLFVVLDLIGSWIWGIAPDYMMSIGILVGMGVGPIMIIGIKGIQMEKEKKEDG